MQNKDAEVNEWCVSTTVEGAAPCGERDVESSLNVGRLESVVLCSKC